MLRLSVSVYFLRVAHIVHMLARMSDLTRRFLFIIHYLPLKSLTLRTFGRKYYHSLPRGQCALLGGSMMMMNNKN